MNHAPLILAALLTAGGCATARPAPRATLPDDSVRLLDAALARARPAYESQADALRSGVYQHPAAAAAPAPARAEPLESQVPQERPPSPRAEPAEAPAPEGRLSPRAEPVDTPFPSAAAPAPSAPNADAPPSTEAAAATDRFGVQVAAFRDREAATEARAAAAAAFPDLRAEIESEGGWHRVVLLGWPDSDAARSVLPIIIAHYPGAWIRAAPVP